MVDISMVNWKDDFVTRKFLARMGKALEEPEKMSPNDLATTITYCKTVENPYAAELAKQAGLGDVYQARKTLVAKRKVVRRAAEIFHILLVI